MPFRLPPDLVLDPQRGFRIYEGVVAPDWTDRNGHMNVVYYRRAFDQATQHMLSRIGLWDNDNDDGSTFALEDHVTYQHELHPGRPFFVTYQLLDFNEKLIHAFLRLFGEPESADGEPVLAATCEHIGVYVDMRTRRSAPMPAEYRALLEEIARRLAGLSEPPEKGRVIGIRRRAPSKSIPRRIPVGV
ncbi:MAG: thioesterase family protein [Acidobacteriota bacterium]|nr:thioesterase family protein [Acidobacteriota bacterium]